MAGVYIHIPFCKQKCHYCDFYSCTDLVRQQEYIDAVCRELELRKEFMSDKSVNTIYFGGGTPSVYDPQSLQKVIDKIRLLWDCSGLSEVTIEVNPDDIDEEYVEKLIKTDFNRLSMGIQSFFENELVLMNRRHTGRGAINAVNLAREAGINNISIDLIYGIPGMRTDKWRRNLDMALSLDPEHISAYHLTIEDKTPFGKMAAKGELVAVEEETSDMQFQILHQMLTEAGYEHYEISNFAKPGFRAIHNSSYWSGVSYLGVGPSAHSYNGQQRCWGVYDLTSYLKGVDAGTIYGSEILTPDDLYNEYIMTSLRRMEGVDIAELERRFGESKVNMFKLIAAKHIDSGLLEESGGRFFIPASKMLTSDYTISGLFAED